MHLRGSANLLIDAAGFAIFLVHDELLDEPRREYDTGLGVDDGDVAAVIAEEGPVVAHVEDPIRLLADPAVSVAMRAISEVLEPVIGGAPRQMACLWSLAV